MNAALCRQLTLLKEANQAVPCWQYLCWSLNGRLAEAVAAADGTFVPWPTLGRAMTIHDWSCRVLISATSGQTHIACNGQRNHQPSFFAQAYCSQRWETRANHNYYCSMVWLQSGLWDRRPTLKLNLRLGHNVFCLNLVFENKKWKRFDSFHQDQSP